MRVFTLLLAVACLLFATEVFVVGQAIETHSNPVPNGSITVAAGDPERSDWAGIPWFEVDEDFDEFFPVDIDRVQMAHDSQYVYMRLTALTWEVEEDWRIGTYIDTDGEYEIGYNGGFLAVGAEYLLEGALYEFTGNGPTEWSWAAKGEVLRDQTDWTDVEVAIPRSSFDGANELNFIMYANNFCCDFGLPDDAYPNDGNIPFGAYFTYSFASEPPIPGDFDGSGALDIADVNALNTDIAAGTNSAIYDLNADGATNLADLTIWIKDLKHTWFGDADLNGEFNSADFVIIFQAGKFEAASNATWREGDWNGDLRFSSGDLVQAFQDGGFEVGPRTAVSAVPEPHTLTWLLLVVLPLVRRLRG
jgi:hypothetical protein